MTIGLAQTATGLNPTTHNTGAFKEKIPSGYKKGMLQQFSPEQMNLFQQMFGQVGPESYLSKLASGDQSQFSQMEEPALRQFGELQGNIASRFSGMGGLGARKSSGFQNTMSSAASNLSKDLQSQRQALQRQAIMDLMGLSNELLGQRPYDQFLTQKQRKPGFGGAIGAGLGGIGGFLAGGPTGAQQGAQLGFGIGSAF